MKLQPLPSHIGNGFTYIGEANPAFSAYRHQSVGIHQNYHFTTESWRWPEAPVNPGEHRIDGFSPNLNKQLHVGHLRNFCVALSLDRMLGDANTPVAMLGASVGMEEEAMDQLFSLFHTHNYQPKVYLDLDLPAPTFDFKPGTKEKEGCLVYGDEEVVVVRSNGKSTYAYHDLAFAQAVSPTHYVTGSEQTEHFKSLGLGKKHLPMGLVLGIDGKKIKSRSGEALLLTEAVQMVVNGLIDTQCDPSKLAWNIICANMLMASRTTNVKFDADAWVNPNSPGMYITYTYVRLVSALQNAQGDSLAVEEFDVPLLAQCSYFTPAYNKAVVKLDPAPIAHYALELAQVVTYFYHQEKLRGGRAGRIFAMYLAKNILKEAMIMLGMYPLESV